MVSSFYWSGLRDRCQTNWLEAGSFHAPDLSLSDPGLWS